MIEPTLRDRLTAVYETWLDQDDFGQRYVEVCRPEQDNGVTSVRQVLEELLRLSSAPNAHIERPAALEHPDSTFMQLLGSSLITQDGPRGLVESVAHHALWLRVIPRLLFEAFGHQDQIENAVRTRAELPTQSVGVDRHVVAQGITDPADRAALADTLLALLKSKLGQRTIRSFFTVDVAGNGYRLWEAQMRAPKDSGTALAST